MKKNWFSISVAIIMVVTLFAAIVPHSVNAKADVQTPGIAEGTWVGGTEIPLDLVGTAYPDWLQVMNAKAVELTKAGQICHPFRGGQFGWVASIRQLKNEKWVKLDTTTRRLPNDEGPFWACAQAPSAGTFALFGYYNGPQEFGLSELPNDQTPSCSISMDDWYSETATNTLYLFVNNIDDGTMIHFKQTTVDPNVTLASVEGDVPVKTAKYKVAELTTSTTVSGSWEILIEISVQGCTKSFTFSGNPQ